MVPIYIHSREPDGAGRDTPKPQKLTLGSLFDGSGGFPLGGLLSGITPMWASEIEPFPIRVTTKRLPFMKHYGDVSRMDGGKIEPVDIITFGSPCQDMSIAGRREGLDGSRSSLFYEAVRIVKEMRCKTNGRYPRYIVWENVPGAFSSNKGADFQSVLEEICSVKGYKIDLARPAKWPAAGEIMADDFSLAWRVFDAQYWGVPQRRKRIYLVADFADRSAGKILFESEGVSGYTPQGFRPWQGTAGAFAEGAGASGCICLNDQGGNRMNVTEDVAATLRAENHGHPPCVMGAAGFCTEHSAKARGIGYEEETSPTFRAGTVPAAVYENHSQDTRYTGPLETAPTVNATYGMGGNNQPFVVETPKTLKIRSGCEGGGKGCGSPVETSAKQKHRPSRQARPLIQDNKSATLGCNNDQTVFVPFVKGTRPHSPDEGQQWKAFDVANTLNTYDVGEIRCNELAVKVYGICSKDSNAMKSDNPKSGFYEAETSRCLDANGGNPTCNQGGMAVVAVQGSMIGRADKNGPQGSGVNEDVSFTLDAADRHAVAYCMTTGSYSQALEEQSPTLMARDYKDPPVVNETEPEYIVRRLTPTECARLQGFPDWWCAGLGTDEPTEDEIEFWTAVFEIHRSVMGTSSKPKSRNQIVKWLKNPHSDSAEYKMWATVWRSPTSISCFPGSCTMHSFRKDKLVSILQRNVRKPLAISRVQSDICTYQKQRRFSHMEIRYNVTGAKRKELVKVIANATGARAEYKFMPTCNYEIDYFTVTKDGTLLFDDRADSEEVERVLEAVAAAGFECEPQDGGEQPSGEETKETEEAADRAPQGEPVGLTVEIPLDKVAVGNLTKLLDAKGNLIRKAMGITDLRIEVLDDRVAFPWFRELPDCDAIKAYTHFIFALCEMSRNAKRVTATEKPVDNEKYAFRCFLLRLGFIGSEYKAERKILLKNLTGSSAFKDGGVNHEVSE